MAVGAATGEDIGIISGADIIALRKVQVESTDYAQREYGVTPEQVAALQETVDKRYRRLKRSGKLMTVSADELRGLLEEAPVLDPRVLKSLRELRKEERVECLLALVE